MTMKRQPATRLRGLLEPAAAELYDYVLQRHARYESWFMHRPGSTRDDAFRKLLREVLTGDGRSSGWTPIQWIDTDVAKAANDPETRRLAWERLADTSGTGWGARMARRNRTDLLVEITVYAVGLVAIIAVWLSLARGG